MRKKKTVGVVGKEVTRGIGGCLEGNSNSFFKVGNPSSAMMKYKTRR